ncbi:MAG: polysaccharide biosynthesis tyrosine autokinase [Bacteroidia bacterium]|nr:polysaccharide biosynthesis tyrosine autokinase [Bacteroidia bacterium]
MSTQVGSKNLHEDELDFSSFFDMLRTKWHYFIIFLILAILGAVVYLNITLPEYQARSSVLVKESSKSPTGNIEDIIAGDIYGSQKNLATEMGILGSRGVIAQAIDELELQVSYYNTSSFPHRPIYKKQPFNASLISLDEAFYDIPFEVRVVSEGKYFVEVHIDDHEEIGDFNFEKEVRAGELVSSNYFSFKLSETENFTEDEQFEFVFNSPDAQINDIADRLKIDPFDKDATIINLTFKDNVPERAIDVLNTIGHVYIDRDVKDKASVASLTLKFVDEQLSSTSNILGSIETELQNFKEKNGTVNLSEESKAVLEKLNDVDVTKLQTEIELKSLQSLLEYVESNNDLTQLAPSSIGIPDPLLVNLITQFQALQNRRKSLAYGVSGTTPALKIIDEQIASNREFLIENIKSITQQKQITNTALNEKITKYESGIKRVPDLERQLVSIQRKFEVNQDIYLYLLQKKAETSIAKATAVSDNKILDGAFLTDEEPVAPNKMLILAVALMMGITLPAAWLFVRSLFKTTIINKDDIAKISNVPIVGVVGHLPKGGGNLVVDNRPKSRIAEAFRSIRTNLQFFAASKLKKTILITSSVSGEGKSFTTINLATVFALQTYKVVVVGLDLRKPKLFEDLGVGNSIGVSTYLIGKASLDEVISPTRVQNVDLIPSGPIPPNPAELLSKPEVEEMFNELSKRYDFIIVDTPPLGIVADALLLTKFVDVNLYIVRENYTKKSYLRSLNEHLVKDRLKNLCILLNDSEFSSGYGYSNAYGAKNGNGGEGYYEEEHEGNGSLLQKIMRKS